MLEFHRVNLFTIARLLVLLVGTNYASLKNA